MSGFCAMPIRIVENLGVFQRNRNTNALMCDKFVYCIKSNKLKIQGVQYSAWSALTKYN